jgi:hypothetical protein
LHRIDPSVVGSPFAEAGRLVGRQESSQLNTAFVSPLNCGFSERSVSVAVRKASDIVSTRGVELALESRGYAGAPGRSAVEPPRPSAVGGHSAESSYHGSNVRREVVREVPSDAEWIRWKGSTEAGW